MPTPPTPPEAPRPPVQETEALLAETIGNLWQLAMLATCPWGRRLYDFMREPAVGSMVLELSTRGHSAYGAVIGRLDRAKIEPMRIDDWDEATQGPIPMERVYYITRLDGAEERWTNARFIAFPAMQFPES